MRRIVPALLVLALLVACGAAASALYPNPVTDLEGRRGISMSAFDYISAAPGDTVGRVIRWSPATDALGAADGYRITVIRAVDNVTVINRAVNRTVDTILVAAPTPGSTINYRVEVRSTRRGLESSPSSLTFAVTRPDAPPPSPDGIQIDSIPGGTPIAYGRADHVDFTQIVPSRAMRLLVDNASPADCQPGRLLTAGVYMGVRGDTAMFVRPFSDEIPSFTYCVPGRLAVMMEGDLVEPGNVPTAEVTLETFGPYSALPFDSGLFQPQTPDSTGVINTNRRYAARS